MPLPSLAVSPYQLGIALAVLAALAVVGVIGYQLGEKQRKSS